MKFEINFDHMPEFVLIRTGGEASVSGFDELLRALVESPRWVTGTDQVVDHRKLLFGHLPSDDAFRIRDIVKVHSKKLGNGRCAFVVNDTLGFGLVRMYELVGGEILHNEIRVVYSINEAVEWLNQ